jgi:flavin reductase (DIM6/NTAB) family NADH-FMN oxidoreductase RutF
MAKKKLAPKPYMYPKPAVLVGALTKGKPNFMTIANCGIIGWDPPTIAVSSAKGHYTNSGIKKEKTFSVNIPSAAMAGVTDYCGLHSGREKDKSKLFSVFFGELMTAPLIEECPVNLECRLVKTLALAEAEVFLGEIVALYAEEKCLTAGKPDIRKINPLIYSTSDKKYFRVGAEVGKAYHIGKKNLIFASPAFFRYAYKRGSAFSP